MLTVACTHDDCRSMGLEYSVPDDGFPVTCGGCGNEIGATP